MITIFINERPIYLTDCKQVDTAVNFFNFVDIDIVKFIQQVERGEKEEIYIYHNTMEVLLKWFSTHFKSIQAAGGLVKNEYGEVLFIFRNDVWDLPKGKVEKKEQIEEAAIREVEEETGVCNLQIVKPLDNTYHIYTFKEEQIFKTTYWFEMKTNYNKELKPQFEEGITKVVWLNQGQIEKATKNTYANIRMLIKNFTN